MKILHYTGFNLFRAATNIVVTLCVGAYFPPALSSVYLLFRRDHTMLSNGLHLGVPFYQYFDAEGAEPYRAVQNLIVSVSVAILLALSVRLPFVAAAVPDYTNILLVASVAASISFSINTYFTLRKDPRRLAIFETGIQIGPYLLGALALLCSLTAALYTYVAYLIFYVGFYFWRIGCFQRKIWVHAFRGFTGGFAKRVSVYGFPRMLGGFSEVAILTLGLHAIDDPAQLTAWAMLTTLARSLALLFAPATYLHGTGNSQLKNLRHFMSMVIAISALAIAGLSAMIALDMAQIFFPKLHLVLDTPTIALLALLPGVIVLYSIKNIVDYTQAVPLNAYLFTAALIGGWIIEGLMPVPLHLIYLAEANLLAAVNLIIIFRKSHARSV